MLYNVRSNNDLTNMGKKNYCDVQSKAYTSQIHLQHETIN